MSRKTIWNSFDLIEIFSMRWMTSKDYLNVCPHLFVTPSTCKSHFKLGVNSTQSVRFTSSSLWGALLILGAAVATSLCMCWDVHWTSDCSYIGWDGDVVLSVRNLFLHGSGGDVLKCCPVCQTCACVMGVECRAERSFDEMGHRTRR
jgi:hypothetical protein